VHIFDLCQYAKQWTRALLCMFAADIFGCVVTCEVNATAPVLVLQLIVKTNRRLAQSLSLGDKPGCNNFNV